MRPFFPYYGSKWNAARYYPRPQQQVVIEPFAGSAGYSLFYDVRDVLLVDSDPIIAGIWSYLVKVSANEIMALPNMPHVGESVDDYALPQEARWLIGFWLNRGSAQPKKVRTAFSARSDRGQLNWGLKAKERIAGQLEGIRTWRSVCASFDEIGNAKSTWFVDPPYVEKGKYYRHNKVDYAALACWARERRGQVIVCEGAGADWLPFESLGNFKTTKGKSQEYVWLNKSEKT